MLSHDESGRVLHRTPSPMLLEPEVQHAGDCREWFVFYHEDAEAVGFEKFGSKKEAVAFIERQMSLRPYAVNIDSYRIICGKEKRLKVVQQVTKVAIEEHE